MRTKEELKKKKNQDDSLTNITEECLYQKLVVKVHAPQCYCKESIHWTGFSESQRQQRGQSQHMVDFLQ